MERKVSLVQDTSETTNVMLFPSNYDPTQLFLAVNDNFDADEPTVASIVLTRAQTRELIAELAIQLAYMERQAAITRHPSGVTA